MNRQLRMAGLLFILGLFLGFGVWQQQGWAAGQEGMKQATTKLKQLFSPAAASEVFRSVPNPAAALVPAAPMATITVTSLGDGAANAANCPGASCRLRDAIEDAASGDTINFSVTGTITLTNGHLIISKNLTISGPGATQLAVSGNNASRIFVISPGFTTAISGLTIRNAFIADGSLGAGIYNAGTLTLANNTVSGNSNASGHGGGIVNEPSGTLTITGCTISGNSANSDSDGGGIINGGSLTVINSTISGNSATSVGGGIYTALGTVTIINSTISGNSSTNIGGGIYTALGTVTIINSTISGNSATGFGGGIYISNTPVNVRNTLIAGNTTSNGSPDVRTLNAMSFNSLGNNLIGNNLGSAITPTTGDQIGTSAAPINPLLAPLGNYGGPTQTRALLPGSPALNAGNNCVLTNSCASNNLGFNLTTDQRGAGFNRQVGGTVDIGAFESRGFTLAILSGNNQSASVNTVFANPLRVTVTAIGAGEPVTGGQVTFTPPGSGASAGIAGNPATISGSTATSGIVTANAIIGGPYNVAASATGATSVNFSLTNTNVPPTITAGAPLSRQRGSAGTVNTIATVSDGQTPVGNLVVTATTIPAGITVTSITNAAGTITANVAASCTATIGANTVVLTVTDGNSGTATANLAVNVTANTAPTVTYAAASVIAGSSTSNATTSATDNGSITGYAVQSQGTYTGTISVNVSGLVSISNAKPAGTHTITIRATDNCGATTDATFTLTITNTSPTIAAQAGTTRQKGAAASNSQIATVNDSESGANGVTVTVNGSSSATVSGVTVSNIVNSGGTVTASIAATCGASNASFTLTASDGHAATATATLNVTVTGITLSSLVNGLTFIPYSQTLTGSGGSGSYTFSLTSGTLPAGLSLNGNVINGTPTTAGASIFTIRADDDGNACFGERTYTINIGSTGLMYYPLARPVRLLDTRPGASPNACFQPNAPIPGGTSRTQPARGTCEGLVIPANATTITGHITTVQSGGGSLTLYPSDAPQPNVTNSNYLANEVLNNAFTVGLGAADGAFKLFVSSNTDVVIDVTGYYAPPSAGGLYFHPLPKPIRLLETRTGFTGCQATGTPLQTGTIRMQTGVLTCDGVTIPTGAQALVGNATTTNSTGNGYLTLYPADATQPFASSSNFAAGINRNAPFTVGLSLNGEFKIYTAQTTDLVIDVMGYYSTQATDANGQGLLFNSLGAPLRLMDTRAAQPACYQPGAPMTGGTVYTQDTQISCTNLTSAARGLVGNVSALNVTANGFVTFWPSNANQPTVATSNYQTGRVFNRHFTVGLGNDVAFKRYTSSTTDLIIDISGFFAP